MLYIYILQFSWKCGTLHVTFFLVQMWDTKAGSGHDDDHNEKPEIELYRNK